MKIFHILLLFFTIFILNACSFKSKTTDQTILLLYNDNSLKNMEFKHSPKNLKILNPNAPLYLNSRKIFYEKDGLSGTWGYHFWADLPSALVLNNLEQKFELSQIFKTLIGTAGALKSDFILESRLENFEQSITKNNSYARISLYVNLIDNNKQILIAQQRFEIKEKLENNSSKALLNAFNKALNSINNDIVIWVNSKI